LEDIKYSLTGTFNTRPPASAHCGPNCLLLYLWEAIWFS